MINRLVFVILIVIALWVCSSFAMGFLMFCDRWPDVFNHAETVMGTFAAFILPFTFLYWVSAWVAGSFK